MTQARRLIIWRMCFQAAEAESELVYREALTVKQKLSGDEHPLVAASRHQLAVVLHRLFKP